VLVNTVSAEALRYRAAGLKIKDTFMAYFDEGMNATTAMKFHRDCLEMDAAFTEHDLADASKNPLPRSVYQWHNDWRKFNLGNMAYALDFIASVFCNKLNILDITFSLLSIVSLILLHTFNLVTKHCAHVQIAVYTVIIKFTVNIHLQCIMLAIFQGKVIPPSTKNVQHP